MIAAFCVYFTYVKAETKCGGLLRWVDEITIPKDNNGYYQRSLHCIFETTFRDIAPNVLLLKWFSFDIAGKMESCTDYLEIYVR